jgi:hypothetical protein
MRVRAQTGLGSYVHRLPMVYPDWWVQHAMRFIHKIFRNDFVVYVCVRLERGSRDRGIASECQKQLSVL